MVTILLSFQKIININSKYLRDYSKIQNNRKNNFEITVMKYPNDFSTHRAFPLRSDAQ